MRSRKVKALIISLVICVTLTGGYYGYSKFYTSTKAATSNHKEVAAKKINMEVGIQGTGSVYAGTSKDIVPNNSGTIQDLNLKVGDKVDAGQKLFVSNSDDLVNNITNAQQNLDTKNLNLQNDTNNYNDSIAKTNAAISEAQNQLNSAKDAVNKMTVTSQIDGVVVAVNNKNGDSVRASGSFSGTSSRLSMKGGNQGSGTGASGDSAVLIIAEQGNPDKTVKITPNNDGTIQNLNLKVGDSVKAGQVLFVSDSDTVRQNVDKAQANLDKQNSTLADLRNSTKLQIDNLDISDAQNQLNSAKDAVNKMTITAPIGGVIAAVNKSNGDSVGTSSSSSQSNTSTSISGASSSGNGSATQSSAGKSSGTASGSSMSGGSSSAGSTSSSNNASSSSSSSSTSTDAVLTIVDPSSMKVKVSVDELDIAKIKEGQKAQIKFDAIGDKVFEGTVESIPQTGTTTNGVTKYDVSVSINDSTGIKIGMSANVNILVDSKDNALAVPADAVIAKDGKKYVTDENNNLIEVKTGIENENYIEIIEGVNEDEKLLGTQ